MTEITPPRLNYFCELEAQPLQDFFANPELIEFLSSTRAGVSLGILDLSDQRAEVVKCLNQAGIPVTAWLLLPKDQGYWFNLDNAPQAVIRYHQFKEWTNEHQLRWARIGLDIEPDIRAIRLLATNRWAGAQRMLRSAINNNRLKNGARAYHKLIKAIHADGWAVETYQMPFIIDERENGSKLLQRVTGLVDLPEADREILMLYSSFVRPWGQGMLWSYAAEAGGIGVGSTGGGVDLAGTLTIPPLNWAELQTDLLLARRHTEWICIFSLEGCAREGFLPLLRSFDWQQPVEVPLSATQRVNNVRSPLKRALWLAARPSWMLFGGALLVSVLTLINRRKR